MPPFAPVRSLLMMPSACLAIAAPLDMTWAQSITVIQHLSFGAFVAEGGGTVTIPASGSRIKTGTLCLMNIGSDSQGSAAQFSIVGTPDAAFSISLPTTASLDGDNGSSLTVTGFTSSPDAQGLLVGGNQTVSVGATLAVPSNAAAGPYAGTFEITLDYQ